MRGLLPLLLGVLLFGGCDQARRRIPLSTPPWAQADYTVVGHATHEECGFYVFMVDWARLFQNERVRLPGPLRFTPMSREESRALYHALEALPEATHLLDHRARTTVSGIAIGTLPIFGERCVEVDALGVRIGDRPAVYVLQPQGGPAPAAPGPTPDAPPELVPPLPMR